MSRFTMRFLLLGCLAWIVGCSDWAGSHPASAYLPEPGQYTPAAQAAPRLRVAVPAVAVEKPVGLAPDVDVQAAASDELFSLLDSSGRCDLTERQRLGQLLAVEGLTGMIEPGRLVHPEPVHGFDYVLVGRMTDLSVRREPPPDQMSVAGVENTLHIGQAWVPKLIANARVELMLIDAHNGAVAVAGKGEFHRIAAPHDLGLQLTSEQLASVSEVQLNSSDTHRILRLALDDTLRPMLPHIDRWAAALPPPNALPDAAVPTAGASMRLSAPTTQVIRATQICPECGARVSADQEFCPVCGHKLR